MAESALAALQKRAGKKKMKEGEKYDASSLVKYEDTPDTAEPQRKDYKTSQEYVAALKRHQKRRKKTAETQAMAVEKKDEGM